MLDFFHLQDVLVQVFQVFGHCLVAFYHGFQLFILHHFELGFRFVCREAGHQPCCLVGVLILVLDASQAGWRKAARNFHSSMVLRWKSLLDESLVLGHSVRGGLQSPHWVLAAVAHVLVSEPDAGALVDSLAEVVIFFERRMRLVEMDVHESI